MFCVTFLLSSTFGYVTDGIVKMSRFDVGIAQQSTSYSIIPSKIFGSVKLVIPTSFKTTMSLDCFWAGVCPFTINW